MGYFQIAVRRIVIADEASAIRADRDRRKLTDLTFPV